MILVGRGATALTKISHSHYFDCLSSELRRQIDTEALKGTTCEIVVKSFDFVAFIKDYP